jgi:LuxR family maltose regulon positive regulatory protein
VTRTTPCGCSSAGSRTFLGDDDAAGAQFTDATELTDEARRAPFFSVTLAYRALLALGRGDWSDADTFVERALSVAHRGRTDSHITRVLVFALAARLALHRQDMILARTQLGEAQRLRPLLSHAIPWYAVGSLLEMAEVSIGLGDPGAARQFTRDAEAVLRRRPDLGTLGKRMEELRGRLGALEAAGSESSTLTSAELRILPLLMTHLTLAGIADRLFLSRHTVKSQVWSMYRSSRSTPAATPWPARGSSACSRPEPLARRPAAAPVASGQSDSRAAQPDRSKPNQPDRLMCLRRRSPTLRWTGSDGARQEVPACR